MKQDFQVLKSGSPVSFLCDLTMEILETYQN